MATIKSYTDIEQAKKLAEILPLESADMWWLYITAQGKHIAMMYEEPDPHYLARMESYGIKNAAIHCWSLAALLNILPEPELIQTSEGKWLVRCWTKNRNPWSVGGYDNPINGCYEMILNLNELKTVVLCG